MHAENRGKVIIIGGGLGGMSAALSLALEGFDVHLYEQNDKLGGKLNRWSQEGFSFDLGPSILTLPHIFAATFERAGRNMEDYVPMCRVRPHWRNFFDDGTVIDLTPEMDRMEQEASKVGEPPANLRRFLDYSGRLYDLVNAGYFTQGLDTARDFRSYYGLRAFPQFDLFRSMHGAVNKHFRTSHFVDIFDFFIKYVGSSAYRAPAFMNCLPTIQFRYDLWYVMGGMYGLAAGLSRLTREVGVQVTLNAPIRRILLTEDQTAVRGIQLADGTERTADYVVSNLEVIPTYRRLLGASDPDLARMERKLEPACSGLVIDIGVDRTYDALAHHNVFYSGNQKAHFDTVFGRKQAPDDPTLYVVAAGRTDPSVAPAGCDSLKILPHIPPLDPDQPFDASTYDALKDRVYRKLERMGCPDLRKHIVVEHVLTPQDIERMYGSHRGSIYGVVSDRFRNLAFKAPKESERYRNLLFVGGSVNPGAGMPMVFLCGQQVAKRIAQRARGQAA